MSAAPQKCVLITGASGLIGSALLPLLRSRGYEPVRLVRTRAAVAEDARFWDPAAGVIELRPEDRYEAVIHLAGENLGDKRLTAKRKQKVWSSRMNSTTLLSETLAKTETKPRVLISASAMGIYGDRGDEILTEASAPGSGFLAELCQTWEAAADPARRAGLRVVHPRMGLILTAAGGALRKMLPAFKFGVGGPLGSGTQWSSWITREDMVRLLLHIIEHEEISGPVNAATPHPARQKEFARVLGKVLHRPALLPVPRLALELLFGRELTATLLGSQRLDPVKAESSSFTFLHPGLREGLHWATLDRKTQ